MPSLPCQRWKIATPPADTVQAITEATGLAPLLAQVLVNRGITHPAQAAVFRDPETLALPNPLTEFPDLEKSVQLLSQALQEKHPVAICGDYDADGMTSTALLLRALRFLGGQVDYAIPSRMTDGYGINERIVREFAEAGIKLVLTVDNGISAYGAISLAVELGLTVIITDHHDLPNILPPAQAILNPKLLPETSLYHGLAGVGVAYILAVTTAQRLGRLTGLTSQLLELYTLGTIADLAPLVGVNRRWLKRGLRLLPQSQILGVQALIKVANIQVGQKSLQPDDIGFQLGPRINAVGRIGDPQWVIELLTTTDPDLAQEQAQRCEETNRQRQALCETIEQEAIKLIETTPLPWQEDRVLLVVHPHWHHGVIGIVASRLVERYGVPVFIATEEGDGQIRGSARGTDEFHVFQALDVCKDLLGKFGGHRAAGGFSLAAANLEDFRQRLRAFAHQRLQPEQLKPLVKIDAEAQLTDLTLALRQQIDHLQPWGIGNEFPVFWTPQVRLLEQRRVGKEQKHLQLTLTDGPGQVQLKGIAWRWGEYAPLPACLDLAYKLQVNEYRGEKTLQLEIVGCRLP
jgi:single-stranded-DNA-specific exonuclease